MLSCHVTLIRKFRIGYCTWHYCDLANILIDCAALDLIVSVLMIETQFPQNPILAALAAYYGYHG